MPVKVVIDTSGATNTELAAFNAAVADSVKAICDSATAHKFGFEYRAAASLSAVSQADVYKETMATIRYYGGVRYIFLPIYLTAMATLATQYFKSDNSVPPILLMRGGLLISLILLIYEASLSYNLRLLWKQVENMIGEQRVFISASGVDPLPHRKQWYLRVLRGMLLSVPYIAGLLFWACVAFQHA